MKTTLQTLEIPLPDGMVEVFDTQDFATTTTVNHILEEVNNIVNDVNNIKNSTGYPIVKFNDGMLNRSLKPNTYYKADRKTTAPIDFISSPLDKTDIEQQVKDLLLLTYDWEFLTIKYVFAPFDMKRYAEENGGAYFYTGRDLIYETSQPLVYVEVFNYQENKGISALFTQKLSELQIVCTADVPILSADGKNMLFHLSNETLPIYLTNKSNIVKDTIDVLTMSDIGYGRWTKVFYGKCIFEPIDPIIIFDEPYNYKITGYFPYINGEASGNDSFVIVSNGCEEGSKVAIRMDNGQEYYGIISALNYNYKQSTGHTAEYILDNAFSKNTTFLAPIQWNNDTPPIFDGVSRYVVSILDGVGCFTQSSNNQ